jgi:hypothetical protein
LIVAKQTRREAVVILPPYVRQFRYFVVFRIPGSSQEWREGQ